MAQFKMNLQGQAVITLPKEMEITIKGSRSAPFLFTVKSISHTSSLECKYSAPKNLIRVLLKQTNLKMKKGLQKEYCIKSNSTQNDVFVHLIFNLFKKEFIKYINKMMRKNVSHKKKEEPFLTSQHVN